MFPSTMQSSTGSTASSAKDVYAHGIFQDERVLQLRAIMLKRIDGTLVPLEKIVKSVCVTDEQIMASWKAGLRAIRDWKEAALMEEVSACMAQYPDAKDLLDHTFIAYVWKTRKNDTRETRLQIRYMPPFRHFYHSVLVKVSNTPEALSGAYLTMGSLEKMALVTDAMRDTLWELSRLLVTELPRESEIVESFVLSPRKSRHRAPKPKVVDAKIDSASGTAKTVDDSQQRQSQVNTPAPVHVPTPAAPASPAPAPLAAAPSAAAPASSSSSGVPTSAYADLASITPAVAPKPNGATGDESVHPHVDAPASPKPDPLSMFHASVKPSSETQVNTATAAPPSSSQKELSVPQSTPASGSAREHVQPPSSSSLSQPGTPAATSQSVQSTHGPAIPTPMQSARAPRRTPSGLPPPSGTRARPTPRVPPPASITRVVNNAQSTPRGSDSASSVRMVDFESTHDGTSSATVPTVPTAPTATKVTSAAAASGTPEDSKSDTVDGGDTAQPPSSFSFLRAAGVSTPTTSSPNTE
jgi:hypothetical protein